MRGKVVILVGLTVILGANVGTAGDCLWTCRYSPHMASFFCDEGIDFSNTCTASETSCWGNRCGGAGKALAGRSPLLTVPRDTLAEHFGGKIADLLGGFWKSYNHPLHPKYTEMTIQGSILIDGEPREFSLQLQDLIYQQDYELEIDHYAVVIFSVVEAIDEKGQATGSGSMTFHVLFDNGKETSSEVNFSADDTATEENKPTLLYHKD